MDRRRSLAARTLLVHVNDGEELILSIGIECHRHANVIESQLAEALLDFEFLMNK